MINDYHNPEYGFEKLSTSEDTETNLNLTIGCELEIEKGDDFDYNGNSNENVVSQLDGEYGECLRLNYEEDGSLNSGFEIITQPMTKNFWYKHKEDFKNILDSLACDGYISHNAGNCGLHFHINRQAFGDTKEKQDNNIEKLILFFEFYKSEIAKLSRRTNFYYCKFLRDTEGYFPKIKNSGKFLKQLNEGQRYRVVNNTNSGTVEIRVFRGTLKFESFWASLEFIFSLMEFITSKKQISFSKVVENKNYPTLKKYCEDKNIFNNIIMADSTKYLLNELKTTKKEFQNIQENIEGVYDSLINDFTKNGKTKDINKLININETFTNILNYSNTILRYLNYNKNELALLKTNNIVDLRSAVGNLNSYIYYNDNFNKKIKDTLQEILSKLDNKINDNNFVGGEV